MMFNKEVFHAALTAYKRDFVDFQRKNEQYKWDAVQRFHDNWDIHAEDLPEMFKRAFDKTYTLLASMNNFPRQMMIQFAAAAPDTVRAAFVYLFDESKDLIEHFKAQADMLLTEYGNGAKQHFQGENAISTYLWLRYPDKYYIYKYSEVRTVAKHSYKPYMGSYSQRNNSSVEITIALAAPGIQGDQGENFKIHPAYSS